MVDIKEFILNWVVSGSVTQSQFVPKETYIPATTKCFDEKEVYALIKAALDCDHTITEGRVSKAFELDLARWLGVRHAALCNSGSSANLLALMTLTSPKLGTRALQPGDEVITTAVGFPTTVNPIFQAGCVPVFVDVNPPYYNTNAHLVAEALSDKTKAIFLAHTLGNPYEVDKIKDLALENNLWLIEDCADAMGARVNGKKVGTYGDLATCSFYPAHQLVVGEGGAVFTDSPMLDKIVRSFRDWGRDCWCIPGKDNTCGKRFDWKDCGELPDGFDHKYIYSHIGYNLKTTDLQSSIGIEQLKKLDGFVESRRANWEYLRKRLDKLEKYFVLPEHHDTYDPSWFGFVLTLKPKVKFTRSEMACYLEEHKVGTRNIFGGNLTKQPAYIGKNFRKSGDLPKSDIIMERSLWIGVHPSLTKEMMDYQVQTILNFIGEKYAKTEN